MDVSARDFACNSSSTSPVLPSCTKLKSCNKLQIGLFLWDFFFVRFLSTTIVSSMSLLPVEIVGAVHAFASHSYVHIRTQYIHALFFLVHKKIHTQTFSHLKILTTRELISFSVINAICAP